MSERAVGWVFVAVQVILLVTLAVLPGRSDFALPGPSHTIANVTFLVGAALVVIAAISLGTALTATPVPTSSGTLRTGGLYRYVRHPIYTGVIVIVVSMAVRSRSWFSVAVAVATLAFFGVKARWEERRLTERYEQYRDYATSTPRFFPRIGRSSSRT